MAHGSSQVDPSYYIDLALAHGSSQVDSRFYIDLLTAHGSSQFEPSYYIDPSMPMAPPKLILATT